MENNIYKPPKESSNYTAPAVDYSAPWSQRKLLLITFTPVLMCLSTAFLMFLDQNLIGIALFGAPFVAVIISLCTANNFQKSKGGSFFGYLLLWLVIHTALIGLGFFGCTVLADSIGSFSIH